MNLFDLSAVLRLDTSQYENAIGDARRSAQGFTDSTNNMGGALNKAQQGFTVFKGVLSNVASQGVNMLANAISSNLGGAIARVDTINNYSTVMKNLGKDPKEAKKAIDELVKGIDGLPTTLDGIVTVQQQFAALGGKMEDATDLTLALNNAALQQWYQMIAAGKSDMMSMRIINEAMPAQMDAIAKSVVGADANWQDLHAEWQKNPEITQKVKDAILDLNEKGLKGTAGFAQQAQDATKGIQTSMQNLQTAIKNGIANILQEIGKENIANAFSGLKDGIKIAFGEITEFMKDAKKFGIGQALENAIFEARVNVSTAFGRLMEIDWSEAFSKAFNGLTAAAGSALDAALDFNTLKTDILEKVIQTASDVIMGFVTAITENGESMVQSGIEMLTNFQSGIIENTASLITTATDVINSLVEYLSENADKIVVAGVKMILALAKGMVQNAPKIIASVAKLGNAIVRGILKIVPKLPALGIRMVSALARALASGMSKVAGSARKLATGAINALKSGLSKVGDIGLNIVKGIGNGITNGYGWIKSKIKSFVGNVKSFLKNLFGINSPSKWARDVIGEGIDEGMALGIEQNAGMIDDAMEDLMPDVASTAQNLTSTVSGAGKSIKYSSPVFNTSITVDGAEDPDEWGMRFADRIKMELRTV